MSRKVALLAAVLATAGSFALGLTPASASLPGTAKVVKVTAGQVTTGIGASLATGGSIGGKVTASTGGQALAGVEALAYGSGGTLFATAKTSSSGYYTLKSLLASTTGYVVCFKASSATKGGTSKTGYLGQCYKAIAWGGGALPKSATRLKLTTSQHRTGINGALKTAAAISGKVTAASGGAGLTGATVLVHSLGTPTYSATATTANGGAYSFTSLPADTKGYEVCFRGFTATGGPSTSGYLAQCWKSKAWTGGTLPTVETKVSVSLGHTTTSINGALAAAGSISGTVTALANQNEVYFAEAEVFSSTGTLLGTDFTDVGGAYTVGGLAPAASDRVCISTLSAVIGGSGYGDECYSQVPWSGSGVPITAGTVSVSAGVDHGSVDVQVDQGASITGTVSAAGKTVPFANLLVFTSTGHQLTGGQALPNGTYTIRSLPPSATGYRVCAEVEQQASVAASTGSAPHCTADVSWDGDLSAPPTAGGTVAVTAGTQTAGADIAMPAGGAITGKVTATTGGKALVTSVSVYNSKTHVVATGLVGSSTGVYKIIGLAAVSSGYRICFSGATATGGSSTTGYIGECFSNLPWAH